MAYAAVAENISIRFAVVKIVRVKANTTVKATMIAILWVRCFS